MVESGVFEHYKGNLYRVLFLATWADYERPAPDDDVFVYVDGQSRPRVVCGHRRPSNTLMIVKWSGNPCDANTKAAVSVGDAVVIYVSLSPAGRVSARTEDEFEDKLPGDLKVERFKRVGP